MLPIFYFLKAHCYWYSGGLFVAAKIGVFILGNKHNYASAARKVETKDETIDGSDIAYELRRIMRNYFPGFSKELSQVADHRTRKDYGCDELLSAALAMFIFKAQSRNAVNNDRRHSGEFKSNFQKLFNAGLPHLDAVQDFFKILPPAELESLKVNMVSRLIENKVLFRYKMFGHYLVAVDASGLVSCDEDRYGCGLKKESKNGKITYLYPVLEAKLVTENGFCISLATEWIINDNNKPYDKQDCEQNAFKRLAKKLKQDFPRLPVCILADALYASSPVMDICENNSWKYLITLQDGNLPALQDCLKDDPKTHRNSFIHYPECTVKNNTITQEFYWVEDLLHKKHTLHYLQCKETLSNQITNKSSTTNFVRITNLPVDKSTVKNLSKAGRLRWKIENEGFNEEKNNGYNMEHLYSRTSFNAQQNYYQCMLIAHLLNQLLEHTCKIQDLLKRFKKITIKYLWQQLLCAMKCQAFCVQTLTAIDNKKHQIRLSPG
ncbi:MAG TPA: transposase [Candidatus Limnocylindrales bacterium]|nr:transposase [Candidatus Limnocylindrales bacterium]